MVSIGSAASSFFFLPRLRLILMRPGELISRLLDRVSRGSTGSHMGPGTRVDLSSTATFMVFGEDGKRSGTDTLPPPPGCHDARQGAALFFGCASVGLDGMLCPLSYSDTASPLSYSDIASSSLFSHCLNRSFPSWDILVSSLAETLAGNGCRRKDRFKL